MFRARLRHVVVAALEPEVAGQPAASGIEHGEVDPAVAEQLLVAVEAHDRLLMAVHLGNGLAATAVHLADGLAAFDG